MKRKILIDARAIDFLPYGVGRYARELVARLPGLKRDWDWYILRHGARAAKRSNNLIRLFRKIPHDDYHAEQEGFAPLLAEIEPDLVHSLWFHSMAMCRCPSILSVQDTIALKGYPEFFREPLLSMIPCYNKSCSTVDHVITPSYSSMRDIVAAYGVAADDITVVPHGCSTSVKTASRRWIAEVGARYNLPANYIFCSAHYYNSYKNADIVFTAGRILQRQGRRMPTVVSTGSAEPCSDGDWIRLGIVPDADMRAILSGATFVVYPSRAEGFGLPLIEAMSCGVPVISSNAGSLPEVGGSAALYFNPTDPHELAASMRLLLESELTRKAFVNMGHRRLSAFSWDTSATEHIEVYERTLKAGKDQDKLRDLGKQHKRMKQWPEAAKCFEAMLRNARKRKRMDHIRSALFHLGHCELRLGDVRRSIRLLEQCLSVCPNHRTAPRLLRTARRARPTS